MTLIDTLNRGVRKVSPNCVYLLGALPLVWLVWLGSTGGLGVDPARQLENRFGLWGLKFLIASLAVTPLRRWAGLNLLRYRRALGLICFFYICLHLSAWVVLDKQFYWGQMWADILKRPYITIGMAGFAALVPLALTSNDYSIRWLGAARWRRLHRLSYFIVAAGAVHYLLVVKSWPLQPIIYLAIVVAVLGLRLLRKRRKAVA